MNNKIASKDYKIKNGNNIFCYLILHFLLLKLFGLCKGDRVSHAKHRHEIPVLGDPIEIIHNDDDFLAVNKVYF